MIIAQIFLIALGAVMIAAGGDPFLGLLLIFLGVFLDWIWW